MKPILFIDFDGTLCHDRFWRSLPELHLAKVQDYLFAKDNDIVKKWMIGGYTSEEINQHLSDTLSIDHDLLWNTFVSDCRSMSIDQAVLEKVLVLRDRFHTVLITDNMDCLDRFTIPTQDLHSYFDEIVNSYNEGYLKNDMEGKMYQIVTTKYKSELPACFFIDNSPKSCTTFKNLGGTSYLATSETPLSYWLDVIKSKRVF